MSEGDKFFLSIDSLILKGVLRENIKAVNLHYKDSMAKHNCCNAFGTRIHYYDVSNPINIGDKQFFVCNNGEDEDCQNACKGYFREIISFEEIKIDSK